MGVSSGLKIMGNTPIDTTLTYNTTLSGSWYFVGPYIRIMMTSTVFAKNVNLKVRNRSDSAWSTVRSWSTTAAVDYTVLFSSLDRPKWQVNQLGLESPTITIYISGFGNSGLPIYYCASSPPSASSIPNDYYRSNRGVEITGSVHGNRVTQ